MNGLLETMEARQGVQEQMSVGTISINPILCWRVEE